MNKTFKNISLFSFLLIFSLFKVLGNYKADRFNEFEWIEIFKKDTFYYYKLHNDTIRTEHNFNFIVLKVNNSFFEDKFKEKIKLIEVRIKKIKSLIFWRKELIYVIHDDSKIIIPEIFPGIYKFQCYYTLTNNYKFSGKSYILDIVRPYWLADSYIFLYFIAIVFLIYLSFRLQNHVLIKLRKEMKEKERLYSELQKQKDEIAMKNKDIIDSITYAQRIQRAILPSEKQLKSIFKESFLLHIPRDIVSGDFYWISERDEKIYLAAVDCTGHGVPGAFMSIIGNELFEKYTGNVLYKHPNEILNKLNEGFFEVFKDIEDNYLRDGMDIALCIIDKKTKVLEYAGAFNPLYIIRNNNLIELKADRFSIGLSNIELEKPVFTNKVFQLYTNDVVYMFSDGYADQFGGPEGKKYKYRRFRHLLLALHQLPMDKQKEFLYKSIMDWKGDLEQVDDILVIGFRITF